MYANFIHGMYNIILSMNCTVIIDGCNIGYPQPRPTDSKVDLQKLVPDIVQVLDDFLVLL